VLAALVALILVLQAAFRSWRGALLLLVALWVSGSGAILAALLVGGVKTLGALVGLLTVFGVAARTGIALVRRYQTVRAERPDLSGTDAVLAATQERVAPVVLTALVTAAALTPFLVLRGVPGGEVLRPLAVVVLGGLVTSTLVTLYLLPALYLTFLGGTPQPPPEPAPDESPEDEQTAALAGEPT